MVRFEFSKLRLGTFSVATGASSVFTADVAGVEVITATHGSLTDDTTGNITVSAGAATYVRIEDAAGGGGSEITT
ncbi:hypothetical protein GOV08_05340, partial [Candidatus Woesearchaeota archaeon]|nr:hypothetical protein [Candidatus Woesearchaeota archaeon]